MPSDPVVLSHSGTKSVAPVPLTEGEALVETELAPTEVAVAVAFPLVAAASKNADAAKALIKFLTAPGAVPVLKAKGMEPG